MLNVFKLPDFGMWQAQMHSIDKPPSADILQLIMQMKPAKPDLLNTDPVTSLSKKRCNLSCMCVYTWFKTTNYCSLYNVL